jgi:tetraacyldisaccharide 4'-kinase
MKTLPAGPRGNEVNPLSGIFGAAVAVRNSLYDHKVFAVHKLQKPVVSVGNISVGGSGKTPFVIALGELLSQRGIRFDILSRGYGRNSQAVAVVDPQGMPRDFGDEPLLMARKLDVPVMVGADRFHAGLLAEKTFPSQLHLLDDGFQHRRLHRDCDLVMLPQADLHDTLLPGGRLREPQASLERADVLVVNPGVDLPERFAGKQVWRVNRTLDLPKMSGRALAFCGIAKADQFFAQLGQLQVELADTYAFPDHYRYSAADIQLLLRRKQESEADFFLTTEKDQVNLEALIDRLGSLQIARLKTTLEDPRTAMQWLIHTLEQRCGCRL